MADVSVTVDSTDIVVSVDQPTIAVTTSGPPGPPGADGGGGGISRVVAAATAPADVKAGADYVCDGTADDVEIQAAITASAGGVVQLSAGLFNLAAGLTISASNTKLVGAGFGATRLYVANGANATAVAVTGGGVVGVQVSDMQIDGNKSGNASGHGIAIDTPYWTTDTQHLLSNIDIVNPKQDGLNVAGDTRVIRVFSVRVRYAGANGFNIAGSDHQFHLAIADACASNGFVIYSGNGAFVQSKAFWCASTPGVGAAGFRVEGQRNYFVGCEAQDNDEHGFRLIGAHNTGITGSVCDSNGKRIAGSSGLSIESSNGCAVIGGEFIDRHANAIRQGWGITIAGTSDSNRVSGEVYTDNATGTYRDLSSGFNPRGLDQATADALYVNVAGDTVAGDLSVNGYVTAKSGVSIPTAAAVDASVAFQTAGSNRWTVGKNATPESATSTGADLAIARYSNTGAWIDTPVLVNRADGALILSKPAWLTDPTPTVGNQTASKQYVDSVAGGGGDVTLPLANLWSPVFSYATTGTSPVTSGQLRATRTVVPAAMKTVQIEVSTGGATTFRVGVYADTPTGPGALLAQTADMSGATAAVVSSALTVAAGACWIAVQNTGGASATLRCANGINSKLPGFDAPGTNTVSNQWQVSAQGAALPGTFPTPTVRSGQFPLTFLQAT